MHAPGAGLCRAGWCSWHAEPQPGRWSAQGGRGDTAGMGTAATPSERPQPCPPAPARGGSIARGSEGGYNSHRPLVGRSAVHSEHKIALPPALEHLAVGEHREHGAVVEDHLCTHTQSCCTSLLGYWKRTHVHPSSSCRLFALPRGDGAVCGRPY